MTMKKKRAVIRYIDDEVDEVVGAGDFHLEQMDDDHWWMQLGEVTVNLHSDSPIRCNAEYDE